MNWPTPGNSLAIARVEFRRSRRSVAGSVGQLLRFGFLTVLLLGVLTVGGAYAAYEFGPLLVGSVPLLRGARGTLALAWLGPTALFVQRAVGKTGRIDHETGLLTTVPAADVAGGLLLAEAARALSLLGLPVVVVVAAFAAGVGAPAAFVSIVAAVVALLALALLVGHIVGVGVKIVFGGSALLTRYKSLIAALALLLYFGAIFSNVLDTVLGRLFTVLQVSPMAWFGDVFVLGIPGTAASLPRVLGAVALFAVGIPALVALDVRATTRLWYADRAQPSARRHADSGTNAAFLAGIASGPTRAVTAKIWRRTLRSPLRLVYVVYPFFFLVGPLQGAFDSGSVPTSLPVLLALCGTWAVGATALNPFGDEGALLPVTLTTPIRGGEFVRGHVLAVAPIGCPIVVVVTAITGLLSPLSTPSWVALAVVSGVVSLLGPVVALAVGTAFPRFGTARVTRGREAVVPSKTAFAVYSVVLVAGFAGAAVAVVPGGAGLAAALLDALSGSLGFGVRVPAPTLRRLGGGFAVVLAVVGPAAAYRYVARRFESYTIA